MPNEQCTPEPDYKLNGVMVRRLNKLAGKKKLCLSGSSLIEEIHVKCTLCNEALQIESPELVKG